MPPLMRSVVAAAFITAGLLSGSAANAQAQSPPQAQPPTTGRSDQSKNIPEQKLDAAAAALQQLATLLPDFQQKLAAASPDDKQRVADEANDALSKAVTDQGLSVEEYNSIMQVAQNDPDVRDKIRKRLPPTTK
jgi:predicted ATPase with chaperone activity